MSNYPPWTSYKVGYTTFMAPASKDDSKLPRFESIEPVVGCRVWKLDREKGQLKSCYKDATWPFREKLVRHSELGLNLGIHAVKNYKSLIQDDPSDIDGLCPSVGLWSDYKADVAGEIWMWGEVKDCPRGYLSEFAYPKKLYMPENTDPVLMMQLEQNYGVPVELNPDFNEYKQTYWDRVMSSLNYPATMMIPPFLIPAVKNRTFFQYSTDPVPDGAIGQPPEKKKKLDNESDL